MRICSVAHALPSQRVTNDQIVDRIANRHRDSLAASDVETMRAYFHAQLERTGACTRHHRAESEKALALGIRAGNAALDAAGIPPGSIDLLIYAGVGRGFLEPATANVFQSELGLSNATCFDLLDACASWLRALDVAQHLIASGAYRHVMLLNCETNFREYEPTRITSLSEVELLWAGLTVGEAATATVITSGGSDAGYRATFRNAGAQFDDCQIPLPHAAEFQNGRGVAYFPPMQFYARPEALARGAMKHLYQQFWSDPVLPSLQYDVVFGHSVSVPVSRALQRMLRVEPERHYEIFPMYGNVVSASLPLAMSLAAAEGRLQRGHRVLLIMGGGGLTTGLSTFIF